MLTDGSGSSSMHPEFSRLDAAILEAHERDDSSVLAVLYEKAAELKAASGESDAAAFLYTQAYVFALESGHGRASSICEILISLNREVPDNVPVR